MQAYATFDTECKPTGFYFKEVHGESIPANAVAISDDDYSAYVQEQGAWVYEGGARVAAPPPASNPEQIQAELSGAVQTHLDDTAKARNYDGILSACTYATSTIPQFRAEGQACIEWRDAVWMFCYQVMADIQAETRTIPTAAELIAELPVLAW
jgi:hypothetical protein